MTKKQSAKAKVYTLGITVSYFDKETDNIIESFHKFWDEAGRNVTVEEVEQYHVSGTLSQKFMPKEGQNIFEQIEKFIKENNLGNECWDLLDEDRNSIITEEAF